MRRSLILAIAAFAALVANAAAQDVKVDKYTLPNGMTVILHEDHTLPVATVNIWYYVGSKDEEPRRTGFAHLFEHLMFMGTERVPTGQFDKIMEGGGGYNNASTTGDRTNYYDFAPASQLPTLLWLEADRMEDFGRMMNQQKLDLQREVVKNERRENYENAPYGKSTIAIYRAMYPEKHPYHITTIGLPEDLDAASVKDVKDFFATYYVPNNASMVVAGDFKPAEIKPLIAKLFGTLPRMDDPQHHTAQLAALHEVKRLTLTDKVPLARTYMVWHSPAYYKPGDAEMDLAASVLSHGFESRLYQRLVVKDGLASDISAYQQSEYLQSMFFVEATAKEGVSLDKIEAAIDDELAKFVKSGPTSEELNRQKAKYETSTISGLQSLEDRADKINEFQFYIGEPNSFKWNVERYRKATPSSVDQWAKNVLNPNARLILRIVPEAEKPEQNPRNERPAALTESPFKLPVPTEVSLSNGMKLWYLQRTDLPLMQAAILFTAGAASEPAGKAGLADMTASMLDQGAGPYTGEEFSKALANLGASFGASAGETTTTVEISSLASNFEAASQLMVAAITAPRFDGTDFEREKGLHLDGIAQENEDPETVARLVGLREFFGGAHPFGHPIGGTLASVKGLTLADVKAAYSSMIRPDIAVIFASGSLPVEQVKAILDKQLANWKAPSVAPAKKPVYGAPPSQNFRVVIVDKPEAVQTVIRFMMPSVPYADPNRLALQGLGTVLGGTFTSRLNSNLREDKGYTYGASSSYSFTPELGYLVAASSVRADVTGASLKEFLSEIAKIRTGNISDEESLKARLSMKTERVTSVATIGDLLGTAMDLYAKGRPLSDLTAEIASIDRLTAATINPLAKSGVDLDHAVLVLVGDKDQILKQIEGLPIPKPEIVAGPGKS